MTWLVIFNKRLINSTDQVSTEESSVSFSIKSSYHLTYWELKRKFKLPSDGRLQGTTMDKDGLDKAALVKHPALVITCSEHESFDACGWWVHPYLVPTSSSPTWLALLMHIWSTYQNFHVPLTWLSCVMTSGQGWSWYKKGGLNHDSWVKPELTWRTFHYPIHH